MPELQAVQAKCRAADAAQAPRAFAARRVERLVQRSAPTSTPMGMVLNAMSACASKALSVAPSAAASVLALVSTSVFRLARGGRQMPPSVPGNLGGRSFRAAASLVGSAVVCRLCRLCSGNSSHAI